MNKLKQTAKWWRDNEKKVLKKLGFTPTPLSGASDLYKEDGYTEHVLCQLKKRIESNIIIY